MIKHLILSAVLMAIFMNLLAGEKIYVGTASNEGIYLIDLNVDTGKLKMVYQCKDIKRSSFLTIDMKNSRLYSLGMEKKISVVRAYSIGKDGHLTLMNDIKSNSRGACHITLSPKGNAVVVANYGFGKVMVASLDKGGKLVGEPRYHSHDQYTIAKKTKRQNKPHAHNAYNSPDGQYVYVSDLGLDKILIYKYDKTGNKIVAHDRPFVQMAQGAGPRHLTFHPTKPFSYVINELDSTVVLMDYFKSGELKIKQTITTLPKSWIGKNSCADIHVHPNGKFLYGSNRGHNSIVIFKINVSTGILTLVGHQYVGGDWPRNFSINPSGKYLLVANQRTNNIVAFTINVETGILKPTGFEIIIPAPQCLKFLSGYGLKGKK